MIAVTLYVPFFDLSKLTTPESSEMRGFRNRQEIKAFTQQPNHFHVAVQVPVEWVAGSLATETGETTIRPKFRG